MAHHQDWPLVPSRYKVLKDSEGFPYIPGQYGQVEWYDKTMLAAYTDHRLKIKQLLTVPGIVYKVRGDYETRIVFIPSSLPQVARVLVLRYKRVQSPAQLKNLQKASKDATSGRFKPRGSIRGI